MKTTTQPASAIEALRKAETALAVVCSFRQATEHHGKMLHDALEGARNVLTAHDTGKDSSITTATLDARELGSVLAGLRMLQEYYTDAQDSLPELLNDIATNCGEVEALDQDEIDRLCRRLNQ
jgi:hypothetical protein